MDHPTLEYIPYVILPLHKETIDYVNTFLNVGCSFDTIKRSIHEYLYLYSYNNNRLTGIDKDSIIREEIFNIMLINSHVKLNDLQKPVYYSQFNYYLDRLMDIWMRNFFRPEGVEVLMEDQDGNVIYDDLSRPHVEIYYSTHLFHDIVEGNLIVRSIYD